MVMRGLLAVRLIAWMLKAAAAALKLNIRPGYLVIKVAKDYLQILTSHSLTIILCSLYRTPYLLAVFPCGLVLIRLTWCIVLTDQVT